MKFLYPEDALYLYKFTIFIVISGLLPLATTWNLQLKYKNRYSGLLVLHLLPLLNPWLIIEMQPAKVFSISIYLVDVHLNWLGWFSFLILKGGLPVILITCMNFLSFFLDITSMLMSTVSFLTQPDFVILSFDV